MGWSFSSPSRSPPSDSTKDRPCRNQSPCIWSHSWITRFILVNRTETSFKCHGVMQMQHTQPTTGLTTCLLDSYHAWKFQSSLSTIFWTLRFCLPWLCSRAPGIYWFTFPTGNSCCQLLLILHDVLSLHLNFTGNIAESRSILRKVLLGCWTEKASEQQEAETHLMGLGDWDELLKTIDMKIALHSSHENLRICP